MTSPNSLSHSITVGLAVPAAQAFAFMCDLAALGRWALGSLDTQASDIPGVVTGRSMFDGGTAWIHLDADAARGLVDYHVGSRERREPRISAHIVPGPVTDRPASHCLLTLTAWRTAGMDDARWHRLCACHEVEALLIQSHVQTPPRTP